MSNKIIQDGFHERQQGVLTVSCKNIKIKVEFTFLTYITITGLHWYQSCFFLQ